MASGENTDFVEFQNMINHVKIINSHINHMAKIEYTRNPVNLDFR